MVPNIYTILQLLSTALSAYTLICFVRVFLTWIPSANNSSFGQVLARICDPYLNVFRRFKIFRFGRIDLSAAVAICVLWGVTYILSSLAAGQSITIGGIIVLLVSMFWNVASSLIGFFIFFLLIRLIVLLVSKSTYGTIWDAVDNSISPIIFAMSSMFYRNRNVSFKGALVISFIESIILYAMGNVLVYRILIPALERLPL